MSEVMDSILASSATQRFLADHPDGWTGADWAGFYGDLRRLFGELDEKELKERVLDEHLVQQRLRRSAAQQREAKSTVRAQTDRIVRKERVATVGLPLHVRVGLFLLALVAAGLVILELMR